VLSKEDLLHNFIGEQLKLNDLHGVLIKNHLEDKAQQY